MRELARSEYRGTPGWFGPGVPKLWTLWYRCTTQLVRLLRRGEFDEARHLLQATSADAWNFHFKAALPVFRQVQCPLCGYQGPAFRAHWNPRAVAYQSRCPGCDSRSRHRGLVTILREVVPPRVEGAVLLFAPELIGMNLLRRLVPEIDLRTIDLVLPHVDYPGEDIQRLSLPSNTFSLVVCNHVLEHVADDDAGLSECARILRAGGQAVFTIPGDFDGRPTVTYAKPDGNGHYRHYGLDVVKLMKRHFRMVDAIDMGEVAPREHGVRALDYAFICTK